MLTRAAHGGFSRSSLLLRQVSSNGCVRRAFLPCFGIENEWSDERTSCSQLNFNAPKLCNETPTDAPDQRANLLFIARPWRFHPYVGVWDCRVVRKRKMFKYLRRVSTSTVPWKRLIQSTTSVSSHPVREIPAYLTNRTFSIPYIRFQLHSTDIPSRSYVSCRSHGAR